MSENPEVKYGRPAAASDRGSPEASRKPVTVPDIRARKGELPLTMVTAYDATFARMLDDAGIDLVLVGDSLGMVVQGNADTRACIRLSGADVAACGAQTSTVSDRLGSYRYVKRDMLPGSQRPLSLLEDRYGGRLVGVPFFFDTEETAADFYRQRGALLQDLNVIRTQHPALFPGTFRDLVKEERPGTPPSWVGWSLATPKPWGGRPHPGHCATHWPPRWRATRAAAG